MQRLAGLDLRAGSTPYPPRQESNPSPARGRRWRVAPDEGLSACRAWFRRRPASKPSSDLADARPPSPARGRRILHANRRRDGHLPPISSRPMTSDASFPNARRRLSLRLFVFGLLLCLAAYLALAYGLAPFFWRHFEHQEAIADLPMTTFTRLGIPGDALNVGLEGSQEDVLCAMNAAGWSPADPADLCIEPQDHRQRPVGPPLSASAGERSHLSGKARRSGVRKTVGQEPRHPPSRAVLEGR